MIPFILGTLIILLGIYAIAAKKNLVKIVIGLIIMECGVNLMLILVGYKSGGMAPIITPAIVASDTVPVFVDPLPQALIVTSIVIGLGTTAMAISICLRLYEKYGTFDILQIRRLRG